MPNTIGKIIAIAAKNNKFLGVLANESEAQSGPFDGGCLICAKALILCFDSGNLVRIVSNIGGGQTEHYGAEINGVIYDFDGPADSPELWIARFRKNELQNDPERTLSFARGHDASSEIPDDPRAVKKLSALLWQLSKTA